MDPPAPPPKRQTAQQFKLTGLVDGRAWAQFDKAAELARRYAAWLSHTPDPDEASSSATLASVAAPLLDVDDDQFEEACANGRITLGELEREYDRVVELNRRATPGVGDRQADSGEEDGTLPLNVVAIVDACLGEALAGLSTSGPVQQQQEADAAIRILMTRPRLLLTEPEARTARRHVSDFEQWSGSSASESALPRTIESWADGLRDVAVEFAGDALVCDVWRALTVRLDTDFFACCLFRCVGGSDRGPLYRFCGHLYCQSVLSHLLDCPELRTDTQTAPPPRQPSCAATRTLSAAASASNRTTATQAAPALARGGPLAMAALRNLL